MGAHKSRKTAERSFEEAMAELEELVRKLEAGDTPLEQSLEAFERGVALVRGLHARLDAVQARIEELSRAPDGAVRAEPLVESAEEKRSRSRDDDRGDDVP